MDERNSRTIKMIGEEGLAKIKSAKVLIVGVGGVGSYAAEAIARAGVGAITVCDGDEVAVSNLNRQLVALTSTIGRNKAEVMAERIRDINPEAEVTVIPKFFKPGLSSDDAVSELEVDKYDLVVDAIDDVDAKVELIKQATEKNIKIVSAMGAAGKFETSFKTADISKTSTCPLARTMRKRLREVGIEHLPVVYSEEKPVPRDGELGTLSYVPGAMGLEIAAYVIKELIK